MGVASSKLLSLTQTVLVGASLFLLPQAVVAILAIIAFSIVTVSQSTLENSALIQFLFTALTYGLLLVFLGWWLKRFSMTWQGIGLRKPKLSNFAYTLVGLLLYWVIYFVGLVILSQLVSLDFEQEQEIGFSKDVIGIDRMLVFLSLVVLAPIVEEILFRGFLYTRLKQVFSIKWSAVIVSIMFAVLHLQLGEGAPPLWVAAIDTFFLSLVLVYLREKTGNIWAGVGLHALKNSIAFVLLFYVGL